MYNKEQKNDENFWISYADLMAGLLFVFIWEKETNENIVVNKIIFIMNYYITILNNRFF